MRLWELNTGREIGNARLGSPEAQLAAEAEFDVLVRRASRQCRQEKAAAKLQYESCISEAKKRASLALAGMKKRSDVLMTAAKREKREKAEAGVALVLADESALAAEHRNESFAKSNRRQEMAYSDSGQIHAAVVAHIAHEQAGAKAWLDKQLELRPPVASSRRDRTGGAWRVVQGLHGEAGAVASGGIAGDEDAADAKAAGESAGGRGRDQPGV